MVRLPILLLAAAMLLSLHTPARAQLPRSARTLVRGGQIERPDSVRRRLDSLRTEAAARSFDSIARAHYAADSAFVAAARTDADPAELDSLAALRFAEGPGALAPRRKVFRKGWLMSDSMGLSKVTWVSALLPGYGQIYNKQYWKLPVFYGAMGTGLALFIHENSRFKPLKRAYEAYTDRSSVRTPELDALQERMIRSNTRRQIYLGVTLASYIYSIGDAAVSYSTNEVSRVKKATTLACIFPGAGQIYNRSYWKVPFVVGGFASMIYCIDWNNRGYQRFKKAYGLVADYDNHPENYPDGPTDEFSGRYSASYLRDLRNNFRRNRDLCIILTGALYVIQIIDAHVDAHLKDYDISDDLSMNLEPLVDYTFVPAQGSNRPVFGFNLSLTF